MKKWIFSKLCVVTLLVFAVLPINTLISQPIFPELNGQALTNALVNNYKPSVVLDYGAARDKLYATIDNYNDSLKCVYSGYTIYVPHNSSSPRTYTNGASPIMNCEHTWPQSLGATGNAKSDMHHLFATNGDVNAARGSFPFAEIPDNQTDKWYIGTSVQTTIPTIGIDKYSELKENISFEVPEAHKGNVARAMFYFYTMYQSQSSSSFFNQQKETFRQWNMMDPVDAAEIARTNQIAQYQQGKPNPFILDTTLIGRAYFGAPTAIKAGNDLPVVQSLQISGSYPNPFNNRTQIAFEVSQAGPVEVKVYNSAGQTVFASRYFANVAGRQKLRLNAENWASGSYFVKLSHNNYWAVDKILLIK